MRWREVIPNHVIGRLVERRELKTDSRTPLQIVSSIFVTLYSVEKTSESRPAILAAVGLSEVMTERNYIDPFDVDSFYRYTPKDYNGSSRKEMDEVYRMNEVVLMHKATGLRIEYLTTESYYGDELRYRVRDVFVITREDKHLNVTGIDLKKCLFHTPSDVVPFKEVKLEFLND